MNINERKARLCSLLETMQQVHRNLVLMKLDYETLMNDTYSGNLTDIYILTKMKIYKQYGRFYRYRRSYKISMLRVYFEMLCTARQRLQDMEEQIMKIEQRMYSLNQQIWS